MPFTGCLRKHHTRPVDSLYAIMSFTQDYDNLFSMCNTYVNNQSFDDILEISDYTAIGTSGISKASATAGCTMFPS